MRSAVHKILVTGGAGFIGSEFVRQGVAKGCRIAVIDNLTYAGDLARLKSVAKGFTFHKVDVSNKTKVESVLKIERPRVIVHFAAETHVDRSIQDARPFIESNIIGTQNLVDLARQYNVEKFLHISTDEVYGESRAGRFQENLPLRPGNPYAATKASAELLIKAAVRTHHFPAVIVRPANNYGPWQYPEKFVPVIIIKALKNKKIPVYGRGRQIREWLHVSDCAAGIDLLSRKGVIGETYNIGSYFEQENLVTVKTILGLLGKPENLIQFVKDRPGHDFRYSVDCSKIRRLGWRPMVDFPGGINRTIHWYSEHLVWLEGKLTFLENYWKRVYRPAKVTP